MWSRVRTEGAIERVVRAHGKEADETQEIEKKSSEKVLTNPKESDIINELSQRKSSE